jgi:hypothetical protein
MVEISSDFNFLGDVQIFLVCWRLSDLDSNCNSLRQWQRGKGRKALGSVNELEGVGEEGYINGNSTLQRRKLFDNEALQKWL